MTTPVIEMRATPGTRDRVAILRPAWNAMPYRADSNTAICGDAITPRRSTVESRERIAHGEERTFDSAGWGARVRRRFEMVIHSPGVVLVGGISAVLFMGLSPFLTDDVSDAGAPPAVVVESSVVPGE